MADVPDAEPFPATVSRRTWRPRLATLLTGLLLLLASASVLGCVHSYHHFDVAALFSPGGKVQVAGIYRGGLLIVLTEVPFENRGLSMEFVNAEGDDYDRARDAISAFASTDHAGWGFGYAAGAFPQKWRYLAVQAPAWLVAAPLVLLSVRRLTIPLRQRARRRRGLCPSCGYDLRGSPGRCPECGEAAQSQSRPGTG